MSEILSIGELLDIGGGGGGVDPSALSAYVPFSALGHSGASVTGISGSAISDTSKLDATASSSFYSTSNPSGFLTSSYTPAFGYNSDSQISSIDGSALAGGGGVTGDYVEKSAMDVKIGSANSVTTTSFVHGLGNVAEQRSVSHGTWNTASQTSVACGLSNYAYADAAAFGSLNSAEVNSLAVGVQNNAQADSLAVGEQNSANNCSVALGRGNRAHFSSFAHGYYVSAKNAATALGMNNLRGDGDTSSGDSVALVIGDGTGFYTRHDLMRITKDGEITMFSSTSDTTGTGIMSSIRAVSAAASVVDPSAWASLTAWATSNGWTP